MNWHSEVSWPASYLLVISSFADLPIDSMWYPALMLYLMGTLMKIAVDLIKQTMKDVLINKGTCLTILSSAFLLYLDASFGVVMWVGGFNLLYLFFGVYWYSLTSVFIIACIILMAIKAFHCTGGVPLAIGTDEFEIVFNPSNYFGTKLDSSCRFQVILDTIFTYSVVHSLVICCWWGMWELENRFILYPCEMTVKDIKAWDSVVISYFLVFVVVTINDSVVAMKEEDGKLRKAAAANFTAFLTFLASLNFWRGLWSLMDFYFFPSVNLWENLVVSHLIGFLGTFMIGTSLTLTQRSRKDSNTPEFHSCKFWVSNKRNQYEDLDQERENITLGMQV
jgi:hypothetical protein